YIALHILLCDRPIPGQDRGIGRKDRCAGQGNRCLWEELSTTRHTCRRGGKKTSKSNSKGKSEVALVAGFGGADAEDLLEDIAVVGWVVAGVGGGGAVEEGGGVVVGAGGVGE